MQVICLEEAAFYELVDKVYLRLKEQHQVKQDKWISGDEAMAMLRIKSPTTLQNMRDNGSIRFSQPTSKLILYDSDSINDYLAKHSKDTF